MSELQELSQRVQAFIEQVKQARKVEKDVDRLAGWLSEIDADAEAYRKLPWWKRERWEHAFRLLWKGQTRPIRDRVKKFRRWEGQRARLQDTLPEAENLALALAAAAERHAVSAQQGQWTSAVVRFDRSEEELTWNLGNVRLVLYDLTGQMEFMQDTLHRSRIPWDQFQSAYVVTPFPENLPPDAPAALKPVLAQGRYFDLFEQLDALALEQPAAEWTLFVEAGVALMEPWDEPDGTMFLPAAVELTTGKPRDVLHRDQLLRQPLFPMHLPCVMVRGEVLAGRKHRFRHLMHYAFWDLALSAMEAGGFCQGKALACIVRGHDPHLSNYNRLWLERHRPELLPELRAAQEEWDILRHDLVCRIVTDHLAYFQDNVAYLAAVSVTQVKR